MHCHSSTGKKFHLNIFEKYSFFSPILYGVEFFFHIFGKLGSGKNFFFSSEYIYRVLRVRYVWKEKFGGIYLRMPDFCGTANVRIF